MASGIIEYLAEGTWTKRMHAGWAAQSGMRAALLARAGFSGPRTVFEGVHGLFHGFANTLDGNYDELIGDFGTRWVTETLAFKPYPCGTMTHPYIDCARRLAAKGIKADDIKEMVCDVGEGTVHRLWEPLAAKQTPTQRLCRKILDALLHRRRLRARQCRASAISPTRRCGIRRWSRSPTRSATASTRKIRIRENFTGHIRATLNDGRVIEERQPHFRGGAQEPLTPRRHRGQVRAQRAPRRLGRGRARPPRSRWRSICSMGRDRSVRVEGLGPPCCVARFHYALVVAGVTFLVAAGRRRHARGAGRVRGAARNGVRLVARDHLARGRRLHRPLRADGAVLGGDDGPLRHARHHARRAAADRHRRRAAAADDALLAAHRCCGA